MIQKTETVDSDLLSLQREIVETIKQNFEIQRRYEDTAVIVMQEEMKELKREIAELRRFQNSGTCQIQRTDAEARNVIENILRKMKDNGKTEVNIFDLQRETNLPFEQISRIMDILENEKILLARNDEE
ncbi:hypothetical protein COV61_01075 [Candidatus Micrarchaeota archaeon CG11_big_fil_rev_8_21_14_0_20_47_5]|nr:MAG: hypothetical protein AUJ17_01465 [Candidatus Micrarchaeota archaeon CG1_02_47_40]PIN84134.1 MAG: hypothetical protein COV61_01075 [Candidatus Micrarchaeota archaeon CG11_big_fil_rev_8_21_14_0_20_47_5]